jgi:branched-chain amino acid transport system ATP-binding protein
MQAARPLLEVRSVSKRFGGVDALSDVSLTVHSGEVVGVIGPNGAGKTTLFNIVAGAQPPSAGEIIFDGRDLHHLPSAKVVHAGIARTFQSIRLFPNMTGLENAMAGGYWRVRSSPLAAIARTRRYKEEMQSLVASAEQWLAFAGVAHCRDRNSNALAYGEQRRLEIARALATEARLLLLDEPAAGMNDREVEAMVEMVSDMRSIGRTIMLVEHRLDLVMATADRIVVLDHGSKIAEGSPSEIRANSAVISAYLGSDEEEQ